MVVELVVAINFMTRHLRTLDLVQLNACVGHSCDIPLSVAGPPNLNTRAIWERIAIWGVHVDRFVAKM